MNFKEFRAIMQDHFSNMVKDTTALFKVDFDPDYFWNLYLDSFPAGKNEIYRVRREYDCSCCRHFVKHYGNIVAIKNGKVISIWDFNTDDDTFQPVLDVMSSYIHTRAVNGIFNNVVTRIGTDYSHEYDGVNTTTWDHFYLQLPNYCYVPGTEFSERQAMYTADHDVFARSIKELSIDATESVLELIAQNSLYRGEEYKHILEAFLKAQKEYVNTNVSDDVFFWYKVSSLPQNVCRIRNTAIGTLLVDISSGMDLEQAVTRYEKVVAPTNYKRPKAIFTKKMLEEAKETIVSLGYGDSLARRFANIDDITVNNILFCNRDSAKHIGGMDVFAEMENEVAVNPKKFNRATEIGVDDFISNVLPTANEVEVLFENRLTPNRVSLIAPVNAEAKSMFKWDNSFSWAYAGNLTDSNIRENVKTAGGAVDGVLRFSIQWNDGEHHNSCDYDAYCKLPNNNVIWYGKKLDSSSNGKLDVDIQMPIENSPAVENITWPSKRFMPVGNYTFFVKCYAARRGNSGFKAEIEFDGQIYSFEYNKSIREGDKIIVASVCLDNDGNFTIVEKLPSNVSSKSSWGLNTNQFVPVSMIMYSPNYWDQQQGIGHRHVFFMLKDCVNDESPNGMYNEFLKQELVKHKRVFEALGAKMKVADNSNQLSGVGFSTTKRNNVIVKVKGATERILNVKF